MLGYCHDKTRPVLCGRPSIHTSEVACIGPALQKPPLAAPVPRSGPLRRLRGWACPVRAAVTAAPGHPAISRPPAARHATFPQVGRRARSARSLAAQGALLPRLTTSGPRRLGSRSPRRSLGAVAAGLAAQGLPLGAEQQPPAGPSRASCHRAAPGTQEAPPLPRGSAASCQNSIWWGIFFFFLHQSQRFSQVFSYLSFEFSCIPLWFLFFFFGVVDSSKFRLGILQNVIHSLRSGDSGDGKLDTQWVFNLWTKIVSLCDPGSSFSSPNLIHRWTTSSIKANLKQSHSYLPESRELVRWPQEVSSGLGFL